MRPVAPGKWSVHEIVLHLVVRDQVRLDELDRIWAGAPPSWAGNTREQWADVNERGIAPLRARSWDEAVRLLVATRERLIAALIERPAEPAVTWTAAHPFGAMLADLPPHDRHHAEQIKLVRISS
jgi:hypothetical protein